MAENQGPENSDGSQTQPNPAPKSVDLSVGGNIDGNAIVGDHNYVVNNYYQQVVEKNIEKHEPDYWALKHPYPMPPNFTGRITERATLTRWLKEDSENHLFILRALGGFGKSALAWQWITYDVDIKEYPKVLWWSFYEGDANFEHFIEETLKYLKLEVPQGQRPQVDELLKAMQSEKILLVMDGFERALRAYSSMNAAYQGDENAPAAVLGGGDAAGSSGTDCVNINAEIFLKSVCSLPNMKSKVLMTTRLTPRAVKPRGEFMLGCREEELIAMNKEDTVEFFHKQKIKGTHAEIEAACAPYGYHPLSLRLLAGRILKDFENPADIVVAQKLKIDGDIIQQKHHVLEVSYNSLPTHEQKLLSTIACFRSPVEINTLIALSKPARGKGLFGFFKKTNPIYSGKLDNDLEDLVARGLLHFDEKNKKFDLHPIVRRYAYRCLTTLACTAAHMRLRDYFATVDVPGRIKSITDLEPVIELYYHTAQAGEFDKAILLYRDRIAEPLFNQTGGYQSVIELLRLLFWNGEDKPSHLKDKKAEAWALNELANAYSVSGQSRRAVPLFQKQNALRVKQHSKRNIGIGLVNVSGVLQSLGEIKKAEQNLRQCIDIFHNLKTLGDEAISREELGHLLLYRGDWQGAEDEFKNLLALFNKAGVTGLDLDTIVRMRYAQLFLFINRPDEALKLASESFILATATDRNLVATNKENILAYWILGAAYRANSAWIKAEENLSKAISMCRQINLVEDEANILLDLARLRYDQKNYEEAKSLAEEELLITERCGYVLQGADVNLFLAQYALEQEKDKAKAKEYAESALKLAYCDGPPYYYKVAYEEAEKMLVGL